MSKTDKTTIEKKENCAGKKVILQKWEESERGWGETPDGFSLHLTDADRVQYIKDYWAPLPDDIPEEYSRPCEEPYEAEVDAETYLAISVSSNGIREYGDPPERI